MTRPDRDAQSAVTLEDLSRVRIRLRINHGCPVINCHRARAQMRASRRRGQKQSEEGRDDARQQDPTRHSLRFCSLGAVAYEPGGNVYAE